jgi:hypothetical protein
MKQVVVYIVEFGDQNKQMLREYRLFLPSITYTVLVISTLSSIYHLHSVSYIDPFFHLSLTVLVISTLSSIYHLHSVSYIDPFFHLSLTQC